MEELKYDYEIPKIINEKITKDLLEDFKDKLDNRFKLNEDDEVPSYLNTYVYLPETKGWKESFCEACKENGKKEIYEHYEELSWYNKESFDDTLAEKMLEFEVIEKGKDESVQNIW